MRLCSVEGCETKCYARGWCRKHLTRWQRHGDPIAGRRERCVWVSWDEKGRPSCEHGTATKDRNSWRCRGKKNERERRWRRENTERVREYNREWYAKNPEKARDKNARRIMVGDMYLGMCGFTKTETEAMLNGSSE